MQYLRSGIEYPVPPKLTLHLYTMHILFLPCYVVMGNNGQWFSNLNGLSKEMSPVAVKGRLSPSSWLKTKLI